MQAVIIAVVITFIVTPGLLQMHTRKSRLLQRLAVQKIKPVR